MDKSVFKNKDNIVKLYACRLLAIVKTVRGLVV